MTARISTPPILVLFVTVAAACAQPGTYRRDIMFTPTLDTAAANYERHAARVLEARGYNVTVAGPGDRIRATRTRPDGGRDMVSVWRSMDPDRVRVAEYRFEYEIRGSWSRVLSDTTAHAGPAVRADVDSVLAEFAALRARGAPPWVGQLSCAMALAREEGFRVAFDNALYDELWSPALLLGSPRVRESQGGFAPASPGLRTAGGFGFNAMTRVRGGLTIAPGADSLVIETWKNSEEDVDHLRARIREACRGTAPRQPRATEPSASN